MIFQWVNVVKHLELNHNYKRRYTKKYDIIMACFCGCETFEKHTDGKIVGCVKCNHGRQNHDDEWREAARKNEEQSQKRDTDFG